MAQLARQVNLGEFDSSQEDWESYAERLDYYFAANDIDNPISSREPYS